tara:strand:- start:66 stop:407 length:342 start_codon:yes stop_codon:yes gene_type:complete
MPQNKNKLITLFIGNISNAITHKILENSINIKELSSKYQKEQLNSYNLAKKYRAKINPTNAPLLFKDSNLIKTKTINKVTSELNLRISKGYQGIDLRQIEPLTEKYLKETKVN